MRTKAIIFGLLILTVKWSGAQDSRSAIELLEMPDSSAVSITTQEQPVKKIHIGANLDMSYVFSKGYSGPMMYFSPYMSYPVTDKFKVFAGVTAGYSAFYPVNKSNETNSGKLMPMTQFYLFTAGNYQVNQKLTVTGSAYKQINTMPNDKQKVTANYSNSGVSVGFNYKFAPGFSFGAQIRVDSRNSSPWGIGSSGYPGNNSFNSPYVW